jgi:hypothetical protein
MSNSWPIHPQIYYDDVDAIAENKKWKETEP